MNDTPSYTCGILSAAALVALLASVAPAQAGPFSGSISGSWSTPVLSGNVVDGATGTTAFFNNVTTAACNLGCPVALPGDPAETVAWGNGGGATGTSSVTFTGSSFIAQPPNTVFTLGTFTFTNGTFGSDTAIFGATLTLTLNDLVGGVIDTKTIPLQITGTENTGTSAQNADFVQFPATPTTLNASSMNVFEGASATFLLEGEIIGDPTLGLIQLLIAPGSEDAGFVGAGRPVPEPAAVGVLGLGFAGLLLVRRRRI